MKREKFSIRKRIRSFGYALDGICTLLRDEHNSRIHVAVMVLVLAAGMLFGISAAEWMAVVICFGMVLMAEAMNSGIEALADLVMPERHPLVKKAKDIAAAGVLFAALASVAVGLIVFIPYVIKLFKQY